MPLLWPSLRRTRISPIQRCLSTLVLCNEDCRHWRLQEKSTHKSDPSNRSNGCECSHQGNRTIGVITKLDLMDKGTDALQLLQGKVHMFFHSSLSFSLSSLSIYTYVGLGNSLAIGVHRCGQSESIGHQPEQVYRGVLAAFPSHQSFSCRQHCRPSTITLRITGDRQTRKKTRFFFQYVWVGASLVWHSGVGRSTQWGLSHAS